MLNRQEFIEWYKERYGHMPPQKLLDKYYPVEQKEEVTELTPKEFNSGVKEI
ncbi:hypothetical protein [Ruminiclostridium josui]|uniref:hypothetical protein n=1 Tax=Ruminiclostridium josui TaxID=1499 RepID=UPI0004ADD337|nr:hypothetical protein [Ruminiclostridium josui]